MTLKQEIEQYERLRQEAADKYCASLEALRRKYPAAAQAVDKANKQATVKLFDEMLGIGID